MVPTNRNIFCKFFPPATPESDTTERAWCSVPWLFQSALPTATFCLWHIWCQLPGKDLCSLRHFIFMQPCIAPSFQFHHSFCSVFFSSLMHLVLAVKCVLFSMFSIKSYIWKWFINKITGWRPVEIGLQGPIILWKMPAMVGFASQRLSIIDSLIQMLCLDCKQWPVCQLCTCAGVANSSLDHHTHLSSFMSIPSSFTLTDCLFYFMQERWYLFPKTFSVQSTAIRSHNH